MDSYRITWIFYDTNSNLSRFLKTDGTWALIYSDQVASIFVRDLPQYRDVIRKYRGTQLARIPTPAPR